MDRSKTEGRLEAPKSGVTIRMYRQGLGDCFLLAFPAGQGASFDTGDRPVDRSPPFYMLVDCGVLLGTEDGAEKLKEVAEDIYASTGGRIDVLVITHEHYDHLSGFLLKEPYRVLKKIRFDELWLAWTEDPDPTNQEAQSIQKDRRLRVRGLQAAASALAAGGEAGTLQELLGFYGQAAGPADLAARYSPQTATAMDNARKLVEEEKVCIRCWEPGQYVKPVMANGLRVYFLGPPKGPLLRTSEPTGESGEVYEKRLAVNEERNFLIAALPDAATRKEREIRDRKAPEEREIRDLSFPFSKSWRVPEEKARENEFFRRRYGFEDLGPGDLDSDPGQSWRRIDDRWLERAADLALQLDNDTNNTSLVMAIELPESRKVLLFPGDAQVGSWLSWHQPDPDRPEPLTWSIDGETVTVEHLLKRTVFYKVGHHGSHNATLRDKGLEMMGPDLVAMIPVDRAMASKKKGWDMPFPPLLTALETKTGGRVIRLDEGVPEGSFDKREVQVDKNSKPGAKLKSRYIQYTIDDS